MVYSTLSTVHYTTIPEQVIRSLEGSTGMKSHFSLIPQATRWAINKCVCHLDGPCWKLQNELREISAQNGKMSGSTSTEKNNNFWAIKVTCLPLSFPICGTAISMQIVRQRSLRIRGLRVPESLQWGIKIDLLSKFIS